MNTIIEECWATHEAYRRLGIPADNIYVHVYLNVLVEARQGAFTRPHDGPCVCQQCIT